MRMPRTRLADAPATSSAQVLLPGPLTALLLASATLCPARVPAGAHLSSVQAIRSGS